MVTSSATGRRGRTDNMTDGRAGAARVDGRAVERYLLARPGSRPLEVAFGCAVAGIYRSVQRTTVLVLVPDVVRMV